PSVVKIRGPFANTGPAKVSGRLILDYPSGGASPAEQVRQQLNSGYAGGSWTGIGINSAAAAAVAADAQQPHKTAVGFAEASSILSGGPGTFGRLAADASSL